jgi:hypothetical protein
MTDSEQSQLKEVLNELLEEKLKPVVARVDHFNGQRRLLLITAIICLIVALAAIVALILVRQTLIKQLDANREYACSSARVTIVSPVAPLPHESHSEFIERMIARRQQLIHVGGLDCSSLPGFARFAYLRGKMLSELDHLLQRDAPARLRHLEAEEHAIHTSSEQPIGSLQPITTFSPSPSGESGSGSPSKSGDSPSGSGPPHSPHGPKPPPHEEPPVTTPSEPPPQEEQPSSASGEEETQVSRPEASHCTVEALNATVRICLP